MGIAMLRVFRSYGGSKRRIGAAACNVDVYSLAACAGAFNGALGSRCEIAKAASRISS